MAIKKDFHQEVYALLKKIPKGKVTTYGALARKSGINPRYVGKILSENEHPAEYPCYKVVRADGSLGGYTISDKNNRSTLEVKRKKLLADGVLFNGKKVASASLV